MINIKELFRDVDPDENGFFLVASTSSRAKELTRILNEEGITEEILQSGRAVRGEMNLTREEFDVTVTNR